jgi:hypothetical protein
MKAEPAQDLHWIVVEHRRRTGGALQRGVGEALLEAKREGRPVVVFRGGQTTWLKLDVILG